VTWDRQALCKGTETAQWFVLDGTDDSVERLRDLCSRCPVNQECLDAALQEEGSAPHGRYGMRGGLMPSERDTLFRANRLPTRSSPA
jgi:hypothetical protein